MVSKLLLTEKAISFLKSTSESSKKYLARNVQKGFDAEYFSHFTKKLINSPIFFSRVQPLHLPSLFIGLVSITLDIGNMTLKLSVFSDYKLNTSQLLKCNSVVWTCPHVAAIHQVTVAHPVLPPID